MKDLSLLNDCAETILATRDMCGNEKEALADWQVENGRLTPCERETVLRMVSGAWRADQLAAGVTVPLSDEERKRAEYILDHAN